IDAPKLVVRFKHVRRVAGSSRQLHAERLALQSERFSSAQVARDGAARALASDSSEELGLVAEPLRQLTRPGEGFAYLRRPPASRPGQRRSKRAVPRKLLPPQFTAVG